MPSLYTLLSTLEATIVAATAGLTSSAPDSLGLPVSVLTGIGWLYGAITLRNDGSCRDFKARLIGVH